MKSNLLILMMVVSNISAMENTTTSDKNLEKEQPAVLNASHDKSEKEYLIPISDNKKPFLIVEKKKDAVGRKKYSRIQ